MKENNKKEECNVLGIIQNMTDEQENSYYDCMYHVKALLTILKHTTNDILPVVNDGIESVEERIDTLFYINSELGRYFIELSRLIEGK